MFRLLRRSRLDTRAYDACVEASPHGTIYGLSWWLDIVSPDWDCLVWVENGEYAAVLPLPVRQKYGIRFVHQPLFCQFLSVYGRVNDERAASFLPELLRRYRFVASLSLEYPPAPVSWPYGRLTPFATHLIPLEQSIDTIRAGYNRDRKMNLQRAGKQGWERVIGTEIATLGSFFKENHEAGIEGGADQQAYALLEILFTETEKRGLSALWYAEREGMKEAGGWFVTWKGRTLYLFNAATPTGRKGNARTFLIDLFLQEHAGTSGYFDFESAPVEAISGFYASFGGDPAPYYEIRANRLPRWINGLWKWKQRLSR